MSCQRCEELCKLVDAIRAENATLLARVKKLETTCAEAAVGIASFQKERNDPSLCLGAQIILLRAIAPQPAAEPARTSEGI